MKPKDWDMTGTWTPEPVQKQKSHSQERSDVETPLS